MTSVSKHTRGFTLLEVIIVIIIVSVLASLALPRFFRLIESSRATEALVNIQALRQAMERCFLMHGGDSYQDCVPPWPPGTDFSSLTIDNPSDAPGAHFMYTINGYGDPAAKLQYSIYAFRNTLDGGTDMFFDPPEQNYILFSYRPTACPKKPIQFVVPQRSAFYSLNSYSSDNCF